MDENQTSFLKKNFLRIICAAAGLLFGLLIVTIGLFKTAFVILLAVGGFYAGRLLGDKDALRRFLDQYLGRS